MRKFLTTFGGTEKGSNRHNSSYGIHRDYTAESVRLFESGRRFGLSENIFFDNEWIESTQEYQENPKVFNEDSYGWAFKPLSIWYGLNAISDGDILFWVDTNHVFISNPEHIIDFTKQNSIFTHDHYPIYYPNKDWTHRDMFIRMGCDSKKYWESPQMQVNILCFSKNDFTMSIVTEWKNFAIDYETMIKNEEPNLGGFREHRHEQSIFSILVQKYGVNYQHDPTDIIQEMMGINVEK